MRRTASRRLLLFLLLALFLLAPLWVPRARTLYGETLLGHAFVVCAKKPTSGEAFLCYRDAVRRAVRFGGPEEGARMCARVDDPLCFQAFAQEAPNESWCVYTQEHGWFAYETCLVATCGK